MDILSILAIIVPTLCLSIVLIYVLKNQTLKNPPTAQNPVQAQVQPNKTNNNENQKFFLPHRVDAYQRIILFMERISPNSLVMRHFDAQQTAKSLQADLLGIIRNEFEHNIAQQIFISPQGWKMVKDSKEEIIKIINLASSQIEENGSALDLSSKIFEISATLEKLPTEITNEYLINELQKLF
jgi:hypothetical protein